MVVCFEDRGLLVAQSRHSKPCERSRNSASGGPPVLVSLGTYHGLFQTNMPTLVAVSVYKEYSVFRMTNASTFAWQRMHGRKWADCQRGEFYCFREISTVVR